MSSDELAGALKYQAADLIPIPMDEAVLDFAILGTSTGEDGEALMQVLLVAAHEAPTARLVAAVESAGFRVAAVDLLPLALIRALAARQPEQHARRRAAKASCPSAVVSPPSPCTKAASHGSSASSVPVGRELTDAIAGELNIPPETAEALKRQLAQGGSDELVGRARTAIERPLSMLLDEVRSSLDYYRNQPGADRRLLSVVVTGGASQLPGLPERLSTLIGLPAEAASPRLQLAIGDIRFPESEYPRLDPYLPAAVGLALGGAGIGTVVDLAPRARKKVKADAQASRPRASSSRSLAIAAGLIVRPRHADVPRAPEHRRQEARARLGRATQRRSCSRRSTPRPTSRPPRTRSTRSTRQVATLLEERRLVEPHAPGDLEDDARERLADIVPGPGHRRPRPSSPAPAPADTSSSGSC